MLFNQLMSLDLPDEPVVPMPKNYIVQRWEAEHADEIKCACTASLSLC